MSAVLAAVVCGVAAGLPVVGVVCIARRAERARARTVAIERLAPVTRSSLRPGAWSVAPRLLADHAERWWSRRRWHRELPNAIEAMARELRAGASPREALLAGTAGAGGPLATDEAAMRRRLDAGQPLDEVVRWWARRRGSIELEPLAAVFATGARLGGGLGAALEGLASSMQARREVAADARAMSAQARASAILLVAAPALFVVVMSGIEPAATRFLLATPGGWMTLALAIALDLVGGLWMYRLTERVR